MVLTPNRRRIPHSSGTPAGLLRENIAVDWENVGGEKPRQPPALPVMDLLETCWRVRGPSGRVITCGRYVTDAPDLEVRAGFSKRDLLRSERTPEINSARDVAETWRQAVLAKGFTEPRCSASMRNVE
jgi:hypothetical protein